MDTSLLKYLGAIDSPDDLRKLKENELPEVCDDLRKFIVDYASRNEGHFASSLGVVELTVALHYVFNTPEDQIVWDVGHQAYGHKILTGRRDAFETNRKLGGISGFPKRSESLYDAFGVGHSSTSISAALGMAVAAQIQGDKDRHHIAVIGDGSMTGGIAFEGLNNAGVMDANLLVIVNDNDMSIDPNVGALKNYLTDITTSKMYNKIRGDVWDLLGKFSKLGQGARDLAHRTEKMVKGAITQQANLFEALNFRYFGPIDGHDIGHVTRVLRDLKKISGPKILHLRTVKGKGYTPAEDAPTKWHASPGKFDVESGQIEVPATIEKQPPKYQDVFGYSIIELAEKNPKIVGVTPAMPSGCSLKFMMDEMPERAFDVGICEQHAVTFSAGMATQGKVPFCNIYSSFMQRAYDQVVHDVAIQNLDVIFCLDRGGVVGADGPTHHGAYDLAYMRHIPKMTVAAPMDELELRHMMYTAQLGGKGPFSIRYPRGKGQHIDWQVDFEELEVGKGRQLREGEKVAVLTIGTVGNYAVEALDRLGDEFPAAHYDMRFVKPLDTEMLREIFTNFDQVITVEDGCIMGGFGSAVVEWAAQNALLKPVKMLGIADDFVEHGPQDELHKICGYDSHGIEKAVRELWK